MVDERRRSGQWKESPDTVRPTKVHQSEWDTFRRHMMSEVDEKIIGISNGIEARVKAAVKAENLELSKKLDDILANQNAMKVDSERYREKREERERDKEKSMEVLEAAAKLVGIEQVREGTKLKKEESVQKYRKAIIGLYVGLAIAIVSGLIEWFKK